MRHPAGAPKTRERKKRDPLEVHTEALAPLFIEKPENVSAKEGNGHTVALVPHTHVPPEFICIQPSLLVPHRTIGVR